MATRIELPCIVPERAALGRKDTHILYDGCGDLAERLTRPYRTHWSTWCGGTRTQQEAESLIVEGDLAGVPASDALMARFENLYHVDASAFAIVPDVAGSLANVPAYLAGQPLSMRRRARVSSQQAPLLIVVDLTSSSSITSDTIKRRGAAILALVRVLAARRPITLWVGGVAANYRTHDYCAAWVRLDTAPLDLARAAHMLTDVSVSRGILYGCVAVDCNGSQSHIPWAYGSSETERRTQHANLSRVFAANGETLLAIPAIHKADQWSENGAADWLNQTISKYSAADAA